MKKVKKITKLFLLILMIILAGIGVGLSGGVPLPFLRKKQNEKEKIELIENQDEETGVKKGAFKG